MKALIIGILFFASLASADTRTFGEEFQASRTLTMTEVLTQVAKYEKQDVVVTAKVDKVCKKKGCWFEVKNADKNSTKVVFKDYSFFVPKDISGKTVVMNGRLKFKEMSVKEQRHYLKDAGAAKAEINAITKPKKVYQFVASGVKI